MNHIYISICDMEIYMNLDISSRVLYKERWGKCQSEWALVDFNTERLSCEHRE